MLVDGEEQHDEGWDDVKKDQANGMLHFYPPSCEIFYFEAVNETCVTCNWL